MSNSPSLARDLWKALETATQVVELFKQRFQREPTDAELRIGHALFIEYNKSNGRRRFRDEPPADSAQSAPEGESRTEGQDPPDPMASAA